MILSMEMPRNTMCKNVALFPNREKKDYGITLYFNVMFSVF